MYAELVRKYDPGEAIPVTEAPYEKTLEELERELADQCELTQRLASED